MMMSSSKEGRLRILVKVGVFCVVSSLFGTQAHALTIEKATVNEFDDRTELTLRFDAPLTDNVSAFRVISPNRQILDFPTTIDNKTVPFTPNPDGRIVKADLINGQGRTRMVLQLAGSYDVEKTEAPQMLKLVVRGPAPFRPKPSNIVAVDKDSPIRDEVTKILGEKPALPKGPQLLAWEFKKKDNGTEVIELDFDRSDVHADAVMNNDGLRIRFSRAAVKPSLSKKLDSKGSALFSDARLEGGDQVLSLRMALNNATHLIRQVGNKIEVELSPKVATQEEASTKVENSANYAVSRFSGRPITLNFKNAEIRTVMQVFADFTNMNLVVSDKVQGKVTVYLTDVPWDQALDIVLKSKGLVSSQSGNVLLVSTAEDVVGDQNNAANIRAKDDMEPMVAKTFVVSYQKTADLVKLIESEKSKLLSSRGTLISDERTSQIFVQDTLSRVERISSVIRSLDKPVKQVMIEAKVVLADERVSKELGARVRIASSRSNDFTTIGDAFGKGSFANTDGSAATNLGYTLYNAASTRLINLELRAFESNNQVRTVSNPRVITSNKEPALIEQGTEIPYQIATSSGATATEFKSANLKLEVTPQIAPDGSVLLNVDVTKDSVGQTTTNGPSIDTRHVKTKVLVSDGGTVILGGIFEDETSDGKTKTPFLGDIPILGNLFKSSTKTGKRTELLIFLTPMVLKD